MVREILVRCFKYRLVNSEMMDLSVRSGGRSRNLDCAAMMAGMRRESRWIEGRQVALSYLRNATM